MNPLASHITLKSHKCGWEWGEEWGMGWECSQEWKGIGEWGWKGIAIQQYPVQIDNGIEWNLGFLSNC
jgi:hypothetical protein